MYMGILNIRLRTSMAHGTPSKGCKVQAPCCSYTSCIYPPPHDRIQYPTLTRTSRLTESSTGHALPVKVQLIAVLWKAILSTERQSGRYNSASRGLSFTMATSASIYNQQRTVRQILKRHRKEPPSLVLHINNGHFHFAGQVMC